MGGVVAPPSLTPAPPGYSPSGHTTIIATGDHEFASVCSLGGDDLLAVIRSGVDHTTSGNLVKFTSTDGGATWSGSTTIRDNAKDIRTGLVTALANGDILCAFTERTDSGSAQDFAPLVMKSTDGGATWGAAVAITHGFTDWAFIEGPILEMLNGDLLAPLYGENTGSDVQYVRVSKSTDGGATWANFATIVAASRRWEEPNLTRDPNTGTLYCAIRSDTSPHQIHMARSTDDGATWSAPWALFAGSGRPALHWTADDLMVVMYRHTDINSGRSAVRWSSDGGIHWSDPALFFPSASPYVYGGFVDLPGSVLGAIWSVEHSNGNSDSFFDTFAFVP